jgi:hypothetical protein
MAEVVYLLCAVTSLICASALLRMYVRRGRRILLWSSLGFVGIALGPPADEPSYLFYVPRLGGFVLFLAAIVDKNRSRSEI